MKGYHVLCCIETFFVLYFTACICTEIWYLKTVGFRDASYGVGTTLPAVIFYFIGCGLSLIICIGVLFIPDQENAFLHILVAILLSQSLMVAGALDFGKTKMNKFHCMSDHDLPGDVKIACRAKFISCLLGILPGAICFVIICGASALSLFFC